MKNKSISRVIDKVALYLFIASAGFFIFLYGFIAARYHLFPYSWIVEAERALITAEKTISEPHHLTPARYDFAGVRMHHADAVQKGVTLITTYWADDDWNPGIRLIGEEGNTLHHWKINPSKIWPESPYSDWMAGKRNVSTNYIHGTYLFENGDILFNVEYLGLTRMNAAGEILWKLPYRTHHSISRDESGHFWVCGMKWVEDNEAGRKRQQRFPGLRFPFAEEYALQVSEDGNILQEISLVEALFESGYGKYILQHRTKGDVLHANDIEALGASVAEQFPQFNPDDLLVSCRDIHSVFVVDGKTHQVKWLSRRYLSQHDPDFMEDGTIRVFDNNPDGTEDGHLMGGTQIVSIKPGQEEPCTVFPQHPGQQFYTPFGGKMQNLPNGNILITEARAGRIFEVDEHGSTVWEWVVDRYNDEKVPEVLEGTRYPFTPEQIARWN